MAIGATTYIIVYLTPNCDTAGCRRKMALLEDGIRDLPGDVVVAKDFNARAIQKGMTQRNEQGRLLLEMATRLDLVVVNTGNTTTYRRPGFRNSIPDVTLITDRVLSRVERWRMVEDYTASNHQYIVFDVVGQTRTPRTKFLHLPRWNTNKLNEHKILEELTAMQTPSINILSELIGRKRAKRLTDETARLIERLCKNSMPERQYRQDRQPQY